MKSREEQLHEQLARNEWTFDQIGLYIRLGFWGTIRHTFKKMLPLLGIATLCIAVQTLVYSIWKIRVPEIIAFPFFFLVLPCFFVWLQTRSEIRKN